MRLKTVKDVAEWRLCSGCGACSIACFNNAIILKNIVNDGIRPFINLKLCKSCGDCLKVCPGFDYWIDFQDKRIFKTHNFNHIIKNQKFIWEGYASNNIIRSSGSSGGIISALAIFCIEKKFMSGTLHTSQDKSDPLNNITTFSENRSSVLSNSGSRYSPASPCSKLNKITNADGKSVFIGKPCDVLALRKTQLQNPELKNNTGLAISLFCAGTPSTLGSINLLKHHGLSPHNLKDIRYRGHGWPGKFTVKKRNANSVPFNLSYKDAWGFLQKYRPLRCHLCPDGMGVYSDISCGDAWHVKTSNNEPGRSIIVTRTDIGESILNEAVEAGYLTIYPSDEQKLFSSQLNLINKRAYIWGRIYIFKVLCIPAPKIPGFDLLQIWIKLPLREKLRSIIGTFYRIVKRGYYKKLKFHFHHDFE